MCLVIFHLQKHPNYKLIVAANRDEFYDRPTASAHFWEDKPNILAGRDLEQKGTWLGINKQGQFATLTNFRDPTLESTDKMSRGEIVTNYLMENIAPKKFLAQLHENRKRYNGFNVLLGNSEKLFYYNNIEQKIKQVSHGTHALSNHMLNTAWPKVEKGKADVRNYVMSHKNIEVEKLFNILSNNEVSDDELLPSTGIDLSLERQLSPLFIKTPNYGTRCSTVLLVDHYNNTTFVERTYKNGEFFKDKSFHMMIE